MLKTVLRLSVVLLLIGIYGIAVPALISAKSDLYLAAGILLGLSSPLLLYYLLRVLAKD